MSSCRKLQLRELYGKILWAIRILFELIGLRNIAIYVIGSLAKNEEYCIENNKYIKISDLDLIVFADTISFVKCVLLNCHRYVFRYLSHLLSQKNIRTHISVTFLPYLLYRIGFLKPNTIDIYEAKPIVCFRNEKKCFILETRSNIMIDPYDTLNLVISSMADYLAILLKWDRVNTNEVLYTLAKRVLTVLYALELYMGLNPPSFIETPSLAERFKLIDDKDLPLLEICSKIKSDKTGGVYSRYAFVITTQALLDLFEKYTRRFLLHFSKNMPNIANSTQLILMLHKKWALSWKMYFAYVALYSMLYFTSKCLKRNYSRAVLEKLIVLLRYRMKIEDLLRLLILYHMLKVLADGRERIGKDPLFRLATAKLVKYWYKYMV
jgi:hypothetical protein